MKSILIIALLFFSSNCFSQKEDYIWLGGYDWDADIKDTILSTEGYRLDFNKKPLEVENDVGFRFGILGNNASISDKDGSLLAFTNGCVVYNRNYQIMPNGDSINAGIWFDKLWKSCAAGYPGTQDVLILPDPGNDKGYYLLHKTNIYNPGPGGTYINLNYSYIDISLDNGKGDVTIKNNTFDTNSLLSQYLSALKHENKKDWWLIQPIINDSTYLTFLIDESGINKKPNQNTHQYFDRSRSSASGTAKFSPDGTKYAIYNYYDQLHVYNFDRATGLFSNHKKIEIYPPSEIDRTQIKIGSVEWSPNGRFIYCASWDNLHQVDIWANDPQDAVRLIDTYNGTLDPFETNFALLVQGPDCRIYLSPRGGQYSIHVINKPNELGTACDFVQNGIKFLYPNGGTLPNFPRFRVDEEEKCDPTITSVFGETVYYRRDLEVYPNPSTGLFTIKLPEFIGDANLVVSNINGQIVHKKEIGNSIIEQVDITNVVAGHYNIEVYLEKNFDKVFYGRQVVKL
ncbi:MAG: T9SS type A sorting domain-containing protein [Saprospiraceae bacterium]